MAQRMDSQTKDWGRAYRVGRTPWDLWGPTPALEQLIGDGRLDRLGLPDAARAAVPGCGRGHDLRLLAKCGLDVVGFDLAPEAVEEARALIELNGTPGTVLRRDVLGLVPEFRGAFDLVYEYTCFCALPPDLRRSYARTVAEILVPGGVVLSLIFPMQAGHAGTDGPPYLVSETDLQDAFGAVLQLQESFAPHIPESPRAGAERWFVWRKPADS